MALRAQANSKGRVRTGSIGGLSGVPGQLFGQVFGFTGLVGGLTASLMGSVAAGAVLTGSMTVAVPAAPTNPVYYFSATGSDANSGLSTSTPKQTISAANALTLSGACQILFQGGDTFAGNLMAQASNTTWGSYGTGRATISAGSGTGFYALNKNDVQVRDLIFTGNGISTNAGNGVAIENSQAGDTKLANISVINCDASAFGKNGIIVYGSTGSSGFNNVLISGCNAYGNCGNYVGHGSAGIMVYSDTAYGSLTKAYAHTNVHIANCKTYGNTGTAGNSNWTGSGLVVLSTDGGLVEYCESYNNGANNVTAPNGPVGIWGCEVNNLVIQYCESYNNTTGTTDGGGFDLDGGCTNSTIQYCYSHGNAGHGFMHYVYADATIKINANNTIRFNISQNDGKGGIGVFNGDSRGVTGLAIYNNTIVVDSAVVLGRPCFENGSSGTNSGYVANNIFYCLGTAKAVVGGTTSLNFRGNCYFSTGTFNINWNSTDYASVAAWRTASGQETESTADTSKTADPQLYSPDTSGTAHGYVIAAVGGYKLTYGSTASAPGTGRNLSTLYSITPPTTDYFGTSVTASTLPIGASATFAALVVDTTPDAFSFTAVTGGTTSTVYTSNTITVSGINSPATITVSGGTYSINGGAYTSSSGSVNNGDTVTARVTSSASAATGASAIVTIGGVSGTYTVTTAGAAAATTFDPAKMAANISLSTDKLTATSTAAGDKSVLSTTAKTAGVGKYVVFISRDNVNQQAGLSPIVPTNGYIGSPGEGVGLSDGGSVLYNWGTIASGVSPTSGFLAFDLVNQTLYTSTDGTTWSGPYTFTNGVTGGSNIYFACSLNQGSTTVNFAPTGWTLSGFTTWD